MTDGRAAPKPFEAAVVLAVAAALLMLPSLTLGTLPSHSSMHNLT